MVSIIIESLFVILNLKFHIEPLLKRDASQHFRVESREIGRELISPRSSTPRKREPREASNKIQTLFTVWTIGRATAGRRLEMEEARREGTGAVHRIVIVPFAILMIQNEGEGSEESRLPSMHLPFRALARKQ